MQSGDRAKEGRLAGAIAAEQRHELSGGDASLDIVEKHAPVDVERDASQLYHRFFRRRPGASRLPDEGTDREMRGRR